MKSLQVDSDANAITLGLKQVHFSKSVSMWDISTFGIIKGVLVTRKCVKMPYQDLKKRV